MGNYEVMAKELRNRAAALKIRGTELNSSDVQIDRETLYMAADAMNKAAMLLEAIDIPAERFDKAMRELETSGAFVEAIRGILKDVLDCDEQSQMIAGMLRLYDQMKEE